MYGVNTDIAFPTTHEELDQYSERDEEDVLAALTRGVYDLVVESETEPLYLPPRGLFEPWKTAGDEEEKEKVAVLGVDLMWSHILLLKFLSSSAGSSSQWLDLSVELEDTRFDPVTLPEWRSGVWIRPGEEVWFPAYEVIFSTPDPFAVFAGGSAIMRKTSPCSKCDEWTPEYGCEHEDPE